MRHDFNRAILEEVSHRPWKMPERPWVMTQTWNDLLFAHWAVSAEHLRRRVPPAFELDLHENRAWLSIVPFYMTNVAPRGVPSMPWISEFPELNVRTYVRVGDRPGIYFFSLDAGSSVAVRTARTLFNLPYYLASMRVAKEGRTIRYESRRTGIGASAELMAAYESTGEVFTPIQGSLEYFLTERYCLYHVDHRGEPYRLEIHHPPWPLQPSRARFASDTMAEANGLTLPNEPPLLHFAKRQDVVAWLPTRLAKRGD